MTHAASNYLVYACEGCGKRIFTERRYQGRMGMCPCCGKQHRVGGPATAEEGSERRRHPRATDRGAKVTVGTARATELGDALIPLMDLSESGLSFKIHGRRDRRRLSGVQPPPLAQGDRVEITLHSPETFRPRTYVAVVRRIIPGGLKEKGLYTIGAEFVGLDPVARADLRQIVARMLEKPN